MMTNEELIGIVEKENTIVIVGASDIAKYLIQIIKVCSEDKKIVLCDNSHKKQGCLDGFRVFSVEEAVNIFSNAIFLISSRIHENRIHMQLVELGIADGRIILGVTKEAQDFLTEKGKMLKSQPLEELQFEVDITAHCNLNCKCCSQFSCIADEEYINIKRMEQDFKRLGQLFDGTASRIYLIGGEPLLHPQIMKCMQIARKYFYKGKISIFTNGILLLKCGEDFWNVCRDNEISIIVTKYPLPIDYQKIVDKMFEEEIFFEFFDTSEDFKFMCNLGLDLDGQQNIIKSFANCGEANNCIKLKNGKLFTCTRPASIYKFNKFFGKNLEVSIEDYIDIYKANSREEVLQKLASPIPFCRYCNKFGERKAMEWGQTEKKIEEWL